MDLFLCHIFNLYLIVLSGGINNFVDKVKAIEGVNGQMGD